MITSSKKKNNKLVSTHPSPNILQLFPILFTYFFHIIFIEIQYSVIVYNMKRPTKLCRSFAHFPVYFFCAKHFLSGFCQSLKHRLSRNISTGKLIVINGSAAAYKFRSCSCTDDRCFADLLDRKSYRNCYFF